MKKTGELLKKAREDKGLSIHEIGLSLKINSKILKSIEEGDLDQLPAKTFLRGFVQSYAQYLKLNSDEILKVFADEMGTTKPHSVPVISPAEKAGTVSTSPNIPPPSNEKPNPVKSEPASVTISQGSQVRTLVLSVVIILLIGLILITKRVIDRYQKEATLPPVEVANGVLVSPTNSTGAGSATTESSESEATPSTNTPSSSGSSTAPTISPSVSAPSTSTTSPVTASPSSSVTNTQALPIPPPPPAAPVEIAKPSAPVKSPNPSEKPSSASANAPSTNPSSGPVENPAKVSNSNSSASTSPSTAAKNNSPAVSPSSSSNSTTTLSTSTSSASSGSSSNGNAGSTTPTSLTTPPSAPEKPAPPKNVELILEALDAVDVEYSTASGKIEKIKLNPEQVHTIKAKSGIKLNLSNGGAVNIIVNGKDVGVPGSLGKPIKLSY